MTRVAGAIAAAATFLIPYAARADVITITALVGPGRGVGTFKTDGLCAVCTPSDRLSDLSFRLLDDDFALVRLTYSRASNSLSGSLLSLDDASSRLVFTPSGNLHFESKEDGHTVVLHGSYSISQAGVQDPPSLSEAAIPGVAAVPEPGAWALLATVLAALAVRRRLRGRFAGATLEAH